MTQRISLLIVWGCTAVLLLVPAYALFLLWDIQAFMALVKSGMGLPIRWDTVESWQWYAVWLMSGLYVSFGLFGLYFLRRAFQYFSRGELFNLANSSDLRRFSVFLLIQTCFQPVHFAVSSVLLSFNHPSGEKLLSFSFGTNELKSVFVALILWVMSDFLVEACRLDNENRQFV